MDELKNNTSEDLSKNLDGNKKTLDRVCADLFKKLKDTDLDEVALRSGAYITGNLRLGLLYFGSDIVVDLESDSIYYKEEPADSRINDLKKLDIFSSAVILHYLVNADGTRISGEWISYRELPDGMFYFRTIPGVLEPLLQKYKNSAEKLLKKIERSGGKISKDFKNGAIIYPFINFPVLLVIEEEDEEFGAELRVLFDRNGSHYLKTDVVKMLVVYLSRFLID